MKNRREANRVEPIRDLQKIEQIKEYLQERSYRDYFLFVFGINSGLRISDILCLKVGDVRNAKSLNISEPRMGTYRTTVINYALREEIGRYTASMNDSDYLFPSQKGGIPISREHAWYIINQAAKACGVKGPIGTHTLRKTFGYHYYRLTHDIAILQYIFGHSTPITTLRYIGIDDHVLDNSLKEFSL